MSEFINKPIWVWCFCFGNSLNIVSIFLIAMSIQISCFFLCVIWYSLSHNMLIYVIYVIIVMGIVLFIILIYNHFNICGFSSDSPLSFLILVICLHTIFPRLNRVYQFHLSVQRMSFWFCWFSPFISCFKFNEFC